MRRRRRVESIKVRRTLFSVLKFERIPRARVGIRTTCFLFIFIFFIRYNLHGEIFLFRFNKLFYKLLN